MPFSELFRLPKGKFDSTQDKNTNTCKFVPENDIVWGNGQISMSSRRTRKVPATSKYAKFGTMDYEFRTPEMGSNEDDNLVHGFNCSDFISGLTTNQLSSQNHVPSIGKRTIRSKVEDSVCNNIRHHKQDLVPPSTTMNFPLFSVPAALGGYGVGKDKESAESTSPSCQPAPAPEKVSVRPTEYMPVQEPGGKMAVEPVLACSSVCSGSSIEKPSDGESRDLKRKSRDAEDSEWPSEEESMEVRRAARSSKRSRVADVHNLSERVRRDRINEKMRALQELVPNCNKSDKASMLDEAIEYLKTLQLQVQMMSMGGGLYMPPMMMQHLHAASMVGMGMNYGIGIPDMIGGSSAFPIIQGGHFPTTNMFGSSANLHLFDPPTLGLPMSTHPFGLSGSKDLMHNFNAQAMPNGGTNGSMNQTSQVKRDGPYRAF